MKISETDALWYKDAIIYELHVKAFHDSNGDGIGDFPGLIEKLDYLHDLGVNCLWLLPFYPSPLRDDGYDIADYYGVHPAYGTLDDVRRFVNEAHRRNLRVITELVINHTSDQHPWFQAARRAPLGSPERDFYVWSDTDQKYTDARIIFLDTELSNWTWDEKAQAYYWHRFFHHQPDLNFDNPAVTDAVLDVMRFWLDLGVDGLRLDAIPYLIEREGTNCENLPETHQILKRFRSELDKQFADRLFLAEANQWPVDVLPYFGNSDECHMAFHFPLMPRIFMALRMEDRHPIIEILRQTPEIPPECQWALFLRNHDELTLEMVTDGERDYMYQQYAADPQMRLNLGIRRRLAPLLENSRRRIELLMSLLMSLPGTPILYYGDELGMGDNVFLGDRDGVRTPMQWSADRNGGFSRADFARLYLPPIVDQVYSYQTVNVEWQQRDPSSLLNWTKRLIALRSQSQTFGRGSLEFLPGDNRKVLCYLRRYQDEVILCVANLSRFTQPLRLDLSEFNTFHPVEMFGRVIFPPIGELPYFLTLGPHNFYWFRLEQSPESFVTVTQHVREIETLPEIVLSSFSTLMEGKNRALLERQALAPFLQRQRWFGGKGRTVETVSIRDWVVLVEEPAPSFAVVVEVFYSSGRPERYFVPMAVITGDEADMLVRNHVPTLIATVTASDGSTGVLHDGLSHDASAMRLLHAIAEGETLTTHTGELQGVPTAAFSELLGDQTVDQLHVQHGLLEQSNTSVFYGNRLIMKVFRRLEPGENPDLEIGRFLTEEAHFDRIPQTAGGISLSQAREQPTTIGMLQQLVPNQGTGWELAIGEVSRYFEYAASQLRDQHPPQPDQRSLLELASARPPELAEELFALILQAFGRLGHRTGQMHRALAHPTEDPSFVAVSWTAEDSSQLALRLRREHAGAVADLQANLAQMPETSRPVAQRVLTQGESLLNRLGTLQDADLSAGRTRVHGDYHLGQVLWVENDFIILDFEGEPVRSLEERRAKDSPLRDVAGMIRSLDYAAFGGLFEFTHDRPEDFEVLEPWAAFWRRWATAAYLSEYLDTMSGSGLLPEDPQQLLLLLSSFILEKAFYEVRYELNHRPNWSGIPLKGIVDLIDEIQE